MALILSLAAVVDPDNNKEDAETAWATIYIDSQD